MVFENHYGVNSELILGKKNPTSLITSDLFARAMPQWGKHKGFYVVTSASDMYTFLLVITEGCGESYMKITSPYNQ